MTLVAGKVTGDNARAAVHALRLRHPMLNMRIGLARTGYQFVRDGLETPDPVEVRSWSPEIDPDVVFSGSDHLHFTEADLPYRLVFLLDPARERTLIVSHFHHAIIDGSSAYALLVELVTLMAHAVSADLELRKPNYPEPLPLEQQLLDGPRYMNALAFAAKSLFREARYPAPRHEGSTEIAGQPRRAIASTRMIAIALTAGQSQALRARTTQAKLSTSDLLTAALLLAEARIVQDKDLARLSTPLMLGTPLDYRHRLPPPFRRRRDVVVMSVFVNYGWHRVGADDDLLATARQLRARIQDPDYLDPQRHMFSWFPKGLLRRTLSKRSLKIQRFCHGLAATHTGRHRSIDCPPLRFIGTFGNICVRDGNILASMISLLLNDRLCVSFTYAPPYLSKATADQLIDCFLQILGLEDSVIRAEGYYALAREMNLFEREDDPQSR